MQTNSCRCCRHCSDPHRCCCDNPKLAFEAVAVRVGHKDYLLMNGVAEVRKQTPRQTGIYDRLRLSRRFAPRNDVITQTHETSNNVIASEAWQSNDGGLLNQSPSCTLAVTFPRSAESCLLTDTTLSLANANVLTDISFKSFRTCSTNLISEQYSMALSI